MSSFKLKDDGYPFKKIMQGKHWIGRVGRHINGDYLGTIGSLTTTGATERDAFEQVVAKHLGYANAADLHQRNSAVRRQNRARNQFARYATQEMLRGNFEPMMNMLEK